MNAEDITRDEAATIRAPALLLTGDESPPMFLLVSRELARCLPNVEQAQVRGASHLLHVTHWQVCNAIVLGFLSRVQGLQNREPRTKNRSRSYGLSACLCSMVIVQPVPLASHLPDGIHHELPRLYAPGVALEICPNVRRRESIIMRWQDDVSDRMLSQVAREMIGVFHDIALKGFIEFKPGCGWRA